MKNPQKILILESDIRYARELRDHLKSTFPEIHVDFDRAAALRDLYALRPDVLLADVSQPADGSANSPGGSASISAPTRPGTSSAASAPVGASAKSSASAAASGFAGASAKSGGSTASSVTHASVGASAKHGTSVAAPVGADCEAFCREVRSASQVPLLLFSGRARSGERVRALNAGADDFLEKPLDMRELTARILAVWRRYLTQPPADGPIETAVKAVEYPQLSVSLTNYTVLCDGAAVKMPPRELELLYFLASSPNRVFSREQLLDSIWGYDSIVDSRTVDVHVKRIRQKIKDHAAWSLDTVRGVGYKFSVTST